MPLSTQLQLTNSSTLTGTAGLSTPTDPLSYSKSWNWPTSGVGNGAADKQYRTQITLAASATQDIDLAGSLTDALGTALTFAKIKKIIVVAADGNTNDVQVTRPSSNGCPLFLAAGDGIAVKPGGGFMWVAPNTGVTVTAGTGDLLTFTNSAGGTSVTFDVIIEGVSA